MQGVLCVPSSLCGGLLLTNTKKADNHLVFFLGNQMKSAEKIKDLLWPEVNLCPLNFETCLDTTYTHTLNIESESDKDLFKPET